jgi:hypothetical protein
LNSSVTHLAYCNRKILNSLNKIEQVLPGRVVKVNTINISTEMSPRYQHHRLKSSRSFRVIRLHPSSEGKPLRCDILEASLDHPPAYEALSYTWGPAEPPRNLHYDGRLLSIMTNCAGALERLRDRRKAGLFWIDSICIDQLSVQERNHQVVLMTEIYGSASRVMVDLGDGTQDSDAVIDFLSRLAPDSKIKKMINVLSGKGPKEAKVSMEIQRKSSQKIPVGGFLG